MNNHYLSKTVKVFNLSRVEELAPMKPSNGER
jgi:hypothetical protein